MTDAMSLDEIARIVEQVDAAAWADLIRAAPAEHAGVCGVGARERAGTVAGMTARVDVLALNRVVNLGVAEPATEALVDEIVAYYVAASVPRFFVQLSPAARPAELADWLRARHFTHYNNWVKLYRRAGPAALPSATTALRVEQIAQSQAQLFAEIVANGFGWPQSVRPWIAASVERPGWRHYLALDGGHAVGAGALFTFEGVGWLGFASTVAHSRRRGAQGALIARRVHDAVAAGCDWLVTETAEDTAERSSPSFRNMRRLGFDIAYLRPNYLWSAPPSAA